MPAIIDTLTINSHGSDPKLDRRVKLTDEQRSEIWDAYHTQTGAARPTMTDLAADYGVDRRLIQFILFPEREARQKELAKQRRKDKRYYDKEKARQNMQSYRNYKRQLLQEGQLSPV